MTDTTDVHRGAAAADFLKTHRGAAPFFRKEY
jgi:hypothetical protein